MDWVICLILKIALGDHLLTDDLDRNLFAIWSIHSELDLCKGALLDCSAQLVLPDTTVPMPHCLPLTEARVCKLLTHSFCWSSPKPTDHPASVFYILWGPSLASTPSLSGSNPSLTLLLPSLTPVSYAYVLLIRYGQKTGLFMTNGESTSLSRRLDVHFPLHLGFTELSRVPMDLSYFACFFFLALLAVGRYEI